MTGTLSRYYVLILLGWMVYGACQEDLLLPLAATVVLSLTFIRSLMTVKQQDYLPRMHWLTVGAISLILGFIWRLIIPEPAGASSLLPMVLSPLQSAAVIATLYVWMRPSMKRHTFYLGLLNWSTVALSVNVTFSTTTLSIFLFFCFLSVGLVFADALKKPKGFLSKESRRSRAVGIVCAAAFILLSAGIFTSVVAGLRVADQALMNVISDFILSLRNHHFLNLNSAIKLEGPGPNGRDRRPVLEIERAGPESMYLKTQVFQNYQNGVWEPVTESKKIELPAVDKTTEQPLEIWMFKRLENVIPAPYGVSAMSGKDAAFEIDTNGVVRTDNENRMRKILFTLSKTPLVGANPPPELTALSPQLQQGLKSYVDAIAAPGTPDRQTAQAIESYFHRNFRYSLDVAFAADDAGILRMLKEQKPAYCTYFASAMALMLRERGIPSRIVVGFLAQEPTRKGQFYLARVKHAHAWTEALLPMENNPEANEWVRFDATPPFALANALGDRPDHLADWLFLSLLRARNSSINMNKQTVYAILAGILLLILLIMNFRKIFLSKQQRQQRAHPSSQLTDQQAERYQKIYQRFEELLQKQASIIHHPTHTDAELLQRLRQQKRFSEEKLVRIEAFLGEYHAARFGAKKSDQLETALKKIA